MFYFLEFTDEETGRTRSLRFRSWSGRSSYLRTLRNVRNVRAFQRAE